MCLPHQRLLSWHFPGAWFLLGDIHCPDFSEHGGLPSGFALDTDKMGNTNDMAVRSFLGMVTHSFSVVYLHPVAHLSHEAFLYTQFSYVSYGGWPLVTRSCKCVGTCPLVNTLMPCGL